MTHPGGKVCCLSRVFHRPTCVTGRFGLFNRTAWRRRSPFKEIVFVTTSFDQSDKQPVADLHSRFLDLLPRLQLHGRIFFRVLTSEKKEEAIAEMIALAWKWFCRLAERGKDVSKFQMVFVFLVARAVLSGRRVTGQQGAKDVMNPRTQQRHGFRVESLPSCRGLSAQPHGQAMQDALEERLSDNTLTPVPEQAAFRIDWPAWMKTRTDRERRIIDDLMVGERTLDVSRKYGISPSRVSQLRQEFHHDWLLFNDDASDPQLAFA
jgi:hypothetical protein